MPGVIEIILLFLVMFDPQIPYFPNGVGFSLLVCFVIGPVFILKNSKDCSGAVLRLSFPFFCCFLFALVFILIRLLGNGGHNFEFLLSWFKAFVVFFAIFLFVFVYYSSRDSALVASRLVSSVLVVYTINALINFSAGSFPDHFGFLENFRSQVVSDSLGGNPYRNSFLSGSGYFSIGTAYGLVFMLISYHFVRARTKGLMSSGALVLIGLSGFVAARTSFFAVFLAVFYFCLARPIYLLFIGGLAVGLFSLMLLLPALQPYVVWMQSFFSEFNTSASASYLLEEMYFWPGLEIFLVGQGVVNDGRFVYTDAGYMQDVLFGGMVFLLIKLSFVVIAFFAIRKRSLIFALLFSFVILLFHMKGLFVYNNAQGMAAFYIAYYYFALSSKRAEISS